MPSKAEYYGVSKNGVYVYAAKVGVNGKYVRLGNFKTKLDAAIAYDNYVRANGLDRRLNFPDPEPENLIPNTRLIRLSRNMFAIVDEEDFEYLNQFDWHAEPNGNNFYARRNIVINGRRTNIKMHSEIMGHKGVDHKDHNGLNNAKSNLRVCSHYENMRNIKSVKTKSSIYKGVSRCRNRWQASIRHNDRQLYLGVFDSEILAAEAYNLKAIEYFGEFAFINELQQQT